MNLAQHFKNLCFILWNIIVFLCTFILPGNIISKKYPSFIGCVPIYNYSNATYKVLNDFINKKILKNKNNSAAGLPALPKHINKKQKYALNVIKSNNTITNNALKNANLLSAKRLKDALATQILISKQHIFRLWDKCAFLYPFVSKNHCSQYNL